jgi:hypothetical protein
MLKIAVAPRIGENLKEDISYNPRQCLRIIVCGYRINFDTVKSVSAYLPGLAIRQHFCYIRACSHYTKQINGDKI